MRLYILNLFYYDIMYNITVCHVIKNLRTYRPTTFDISLVSVFCQCYFSQNTSSYTRLVVVTLKETKCLSY